MEKYKKMWGGKLLYKGNNITLLEGEDFITGNQSPTLCCILSMSFVLTVTFTKC